MMPSEFHKKKQDRFGKIFGKDSMLISYIGNGDNLCLSGYIEQRIFLERVINENVRRK